MLTECGYFVAQPQPPETLSFIHGHQPCAGASGFGGSEWTTGGGVTGGVTGGDTTGGCGGGATACGCTVSTNAIVAVNPLPASLANSVAR